MEPSKINLISIHGAAWVCSYKLQPDCKRQIFDFYPSATVINFCTTVLNFQIPGDFLGLRSILLRTSDHSFEPTVNILAIEVSKRNLLDAFFETPRMATAILWAASRDEVVSRMWWKLSSGVLRACGFGPDQAARSRLIGAIG
jgi:CRP-like cAMP-binding protein